MFKRWCLHQKIRKTAKNKAARVFRVAFCLKLTKIKKTRTRRVKRHSRDRQGGLARRRMGLVYTRGRV